MNRRPSSTTIMHAMAFACPGRYLLGSVTSRLHHWGYAEGLGVHQLSGASLAPVLDYRELWLDKFHFSPHKHCETLRIGDWVECYGMKNGQPFVIHHRVGGCPR